MRRLGLLLLIALLAPLAAHATPPAEIYCIQSSSTPCSSSTQVGNGSQGEAGYHAFGKLNDWGLQLGLFSNQASNEFLATPNGTSGIPSLRIIVLADLPPINLSLTGSNGGVTGTLGYANGGTGLTTLTANDCLAANSSANGYVFIACSATVNGQTVALGGSANVNPAAPQYSIAVNGGSGAPIGYIAIPGSTGTYCIDYSSLTGIPTLTNTGCPGAGGSGITTQTNGTNNLSQDTLNLESGQGVSVTNPSSGNVQITSSYSVRTASAATDTILTSDCANGVYYDYAGTVTVTLPQAAGSFVGCSVDIWAASVTTVTVTPTTSTITPANSGSSLQIGPSLWALIAAQSGNYLAYGTATTSFGNVSTSGTPAQYQVGVWVNGAQLQGVGPGTSGQCFTSNGAASYPSFQTCPSSGGGGTAANVQVFTATGTWTKPSGSPQLTSVKCIGAGGGGGSGAVEPSGTAADGGGGGGGGVTESALFSTSSLPSTISITVGAGGAGGASKTSTAVGNNGSNGGSSTFGSYLTAFGGGWGEGGQSAATTNGGAGGGYISGGSGSTQGQGCGVSGAQGAGTVATCDGSGAAGAGGSSAAGAGNNGGNAAFGGAGAGSGGGLATTPAAVSGGNGGNVNGATGGAGAAAGGSCSAGTQATGIFASGSGAGAGASSTTGNAVSGCNGSVGAGGGGGGAALNGVGNSGAGGTGGPGECVAVTTY